MNSISWFLYWAEVSDGLRGVASNWCVITSIAIFFGTIVWFVARIIQAANSNNQGVQKDINQFMGFYKPFFWTVLFFCVLTTLISSFMPSKQTMYAMAASELGEKVINSDALKGVGNDAYKALQIWIKRQIDPPVESKDKK